MNDEQTASALAKSVIFNELGPAALASVARSCRRRVVKKGQYVFQQGAPGDRLYVIVEGRVKVVYVSEDGDELVLATMGPSDTFGELALLDGGPRSVRSKRWSRQRS